MNHEHILQTAVDVTIAFLSNNETHPDCVPNLLTSLYESIAKLDTPKPDPIALSPAVPVRQSVKPDYLICLEDGKKMKMLRRHLASHYDMTPEQYRAKWGLPVDYPMVAPNYSAKRRDLALASGLGQKKAAPKRGRRKAA